ncbi:hypothetical protein L0F63_005592, partial [Massospora cicadina]
PLNNPVVPVVLPRLRIPTKALSLRVAASPTSLACITGSKKDRGGEFWRYLFR